MHLIVRQGAWRRLLLLVVLPMLAIGVHAVPPESGLYILANELSSDRPSRYFHIEIQDETARLTAVAFDPASGKPETYVAEAELRDDAQFPGNAPHPVAITEGYSPIHWFRGELYRLSGGACLTCFQQDAPVPEPVGSVGVWFDHLTAAAIDIRLTSDAAPPGVPTSMLSYLVRRNFGRQIILRESGGSQFAYVLIQHDLRGEWVFVDQAPAGPYRGPVMHFDFTEIELDPPAAVVEPTRLILPLGANDYTITYRDTGRDAEFRCTPSARQAGGKIGGCELHQHGLLLFSARDNDLGIDRIHGFRGDLPQITIPVAWISDPWRRPETVIGVRVHPAPANLSLPPPTTSRRRPAPSGPGAPWTGEHRQSIPRRGTGPRWGRIPVSATGRGRSGVAPVPPVGCNGRRCSASDGQKAPRR